MALLSDPVFRSTSPDQGYEDSWDWTDKEKTMTQQYVYLPHGAPYPQYHPQAPSYSTASPTSYYAAPNGSSYTNQSNHDPYGTQHRTRYGQQEPAREHSRYGQRPPWRSDGDNHHAYDARERSPVRNSSASRYPTGPHDDREDDRYRRGYRRSPSRDPRDRFPVRDRPLVRDRSPMRDRLSLRERSPIRGRPPARARSPIRGEQERGGKDSKRGRPSVKIVRSTRPRGTDVPRRSDDSSTVTTPVSSSIPPPDQPLQYNKNSQPLGDTRPSTTVSTFNYRHTVSPDRGCKSPPFWYAGQKGMEDLPPAKDEPVIELCCVNCGATVHQTWECSHPPNLRFAERCQAWIEEQLQRRAAWRRHVHLGEPLPPNYDIHPIQPLACDTLQAVIDEIKREDGAMVDSLMDVCDESTSRTLPNNTISAPPRVSSTLTTRIKVEDVPGSPHHLLHTDGSDHRSRDNSVPDQAPDPLLSSHTALPSQPSYPIGPLGSHNGPRSPLSPHRPNPRSLPETDWHLRHSSVPTLRGFRMQDSPALIHFAIDRVDVLNRLAEPAKDDPLFEELSTTDDVGDIPQKLRNNFVIKLHGGEDWTKKGFNLDTLLCEGVLRSRSWAEKKEYEFQDLNTVAKREITGHEPETGIHVLQTFEQFFEEAGYVHTRKNSLNCYYESFNWPACLRPLQSKTLKSYNGEIPSRSPAIEMSELTEETWFVASHAWSWTGAHHNAGGRYTYAQVLLGERWWYYFRPNKETEIRMVEDPVGFTGDLISYDYETMNRLGKFYYVPLEAGSGLLQPSWTKHFVWTPEDSFMAGKLFDLPSFARTEHCMREEHACGETSTTVNRHGWYNALLNFAVTLPSVQPNPLTLPDEDLRALHRMLLNPRAYVPEDESYEKEQDINLFLVVDEVQRIRTAPEPGRIGFKPHPNADANGNGNGNGSRYRSALGEMSVRSITKAKYRKCWKIEDNVEVELDAMHGMNVEVLMQSIPAIEAIFWKRNLEVPVVQMLPYPEQV